MTDQNKLPDTTPAVDSTTPAVDSTTPAIDTTTPAVDLTTPAVDNTSADADSTNAEDSQETALEYNEAADLLVTAHELFAIGDKEEALRMAALAFASPSMPVLATGLSQMNEQANPASESDLSEVLAALAEDEGLAPESELDEEMEQHIQAALEELDAGDERSFSVFAKKATKAVKNAGKVKKEDKGSKESSKDADEAADEDNDSGEADDELEKKAKPAAKPPVDDKPVSFESVEPTGKFQNVGKETTEYALSAVERAMMNKASITGGRQARRLAKTIKL